MSGSHLGQRGAHRTPIMSRKLQRRMTTTLGHLPDPESFISLGKTIGSGAYGKVYKGLITNTKEIVAVKTVNCP